jgi:hypothetical protein
MLMECIQSKLNDIMEGTAFFSQLHQSHHFSSGIAFSTIKTTVKH